MRCAQPPGVEQPPAAHWPAEGVMSLLPSRANHNWAKRTSTAFAATYRLTPPIPSLRPFCESTLCLTTISARSEFDYPGHAATGLAMP